MFNSFPQVYTQMVDYFNNGEINLDSKNGLIFKGNVYLGSPPQELTVDFDTGSSKAWFFSKDKCERDMNGNCPVDNAKFDTTKSSSHTVTQRKDQISYALGYVSGYIANDNFCLFKDQPDFCFAKGLKFLEINKAKAMENYNINGLIGLSPLSNSETVPSFLSQIMADNNPSLQPVFSFYLAQTPFRYSKLIFGDYDIQNYAKKGLTAEDILWVPLSQENKLNWTIKVRGIKSPTGYITKSKVSDQFVLPSLAEERFMITDSGMSFAIIPLRDLIGIASFLNQTGYLCGSGDSGKFGGGYIRCECVTSTYDQVPDLTMEIAIDHELKTLKIPKEIYTMKEGVFSSSF